MTRPRPEVRDEVATNSYKKWLGVSLPRSPMTWLSFAERYRALLGTRELFPEVIDHKQVLREALHTELK